MKVSNVLAAGVTAAALLAAGSAQASGIFFVNPSAVNAAWVTKTGPVGSNGSFQADYIDGRYNEVITLTPVTATTGTFAYSLLWTGQSWTLGGTNVNLTACSTTTNVSCSGLGLTYVLFATLKGTGTYSSTGATFDFFPSLGGMLELWAATSIGPATAPATGSGNYTFPNTGAQKLLAGSIIGAAGQLRPGSGGDNGSFGAVRTVVPTATGSMFFPAPNPFYPFSFEAGNFNNYWLSGFDPSKGDFTQTLGGQAQIFFDVPEHVFTNSFE